MQPQDNPRSCPEHACAPWVCDPAHAAGVSLGAWLRAQVPGRPMLPAEVAEENARLDAIVAARIAARGTQLTLDGAR